MQLRNKRLQIQTIKECTLGIGLASALLAANAHAEPIIGLTSATGLDNALVSFDSATPGATSAPVPISGLAAGETILGIDIRPTTRQLFGLGSANNLYTINPLTGTATLVAPLTANPTDASNPFVALNGTSFGIDFNPVPDLAGNPSLRVISNNDQNLRINANNGQAITDTNIGPDATEPGLNPTITGAAYVNNDVNPATGTTLYAIDSALNAFLESTNANNGTYVTEGLFGFDISDLVGFDISGTGVGFAAFTADLLTGPASLYTIDLSSGVATALGTIGSGAFSVLDIAALPSAVPEPGSIALLSAGMVPLLLGMRMRKRA